MAKLIVLGIAIWTTLRQDLPAILTASRTNAAALPAQASHVVLHLLISMVAVQAMIAILDLIWVRWSHARGLRMSRAEIREEHKQTEGDPQVKRRVRRIQIQRARKRMLAAVPKATVVVTNPTHYAVALAYDRSKTAAPRVVAKGVDTLAARIRDVAREHQVPVVANPPLARALYTVELDAEIPPEHYQAAAEIIAYVWRLRGRIGAASTGERR